MMLIEDGGAPRPVTRDDIRAAFANEMAPVRANVPQLLSVGNDPTQPAEVRYAALMEVMRITGPPGTADAAAAELARRHAAGAGREPGGRPGTNTSSTIGYDAYDFKPFDRWMNPAIVGLAITILGVALFSGLLEPPKLLVLQLAPFVVGLPLLLGPLIYRWRFARRRRDHRAGREGRSYMSLWKLVPAIMLLTGAVGFAAAPTAYDMALDNYLFRQVKQETLDTTRGKNSSLMEAADRYLREMPAGSHRAAVLEIVDDHNYAVARRHEDPVRGMCDYLAVPTNERHRGGADNQLFELARDDDGGFDVAALRTYLGQARATNHRDEANELIGRYYDDAIGRLRARSGDQSPPRMRASLLGLLRYLRTADSPQVRLSFTSDSILAPASGSRAATNEAAELQSLRDAYPDLVAVIEPPQRAFTEDLVRSRELVVRRLLASSFKGVLRASLLELIEAEAGEADTPLIRVDYHVYPSGKLIRSGKRASGAGSRPRCCAAFRSTGTLRSNCPARRWQSRCRSPQLPAARCATSPRSTRRNGARTR
ncbi:MAG: hypothetical protein AB7S36_20805 [Planctomycetota bacterium]